MGFSGQQSGGHLTGISSIGREPGHLCRYHLPGPVLMNPDDLHPVLLTARSAVLLIFFMPSDRITRPQWVALTALADSIQAQLGSLVRVLCIDEDGHPDVVQTFAITQTPTFVLLRRGVELWRQQGLSDEATLVGLIQGSLADGPVKNQLLT